MFIFPSHRFNPKLVTAMPVPQVVSGGANLNDDETTIQTDGGGRWSVTHGNIDLRGPLMLRLWESWVAYLAGGAQVILVPLLSLPTAPRPIAGGGIARPSRLMADDDRFPTSVAYAAPYIKAVTAAPAGIRATTLSINVTQGGRLEGGEKFGIGRRGHIVERVVSRAGQVAECIIFPPTREAIPSGTPINFEWPVVQCRAVMGQNLAPDVSFGRSAGVSISFVEDFSDAS